MVMTRCEGAAIRRSRWHRHWARRLHDYNAYSANLLQLAGAQ